MVDEAGLLVLPPGLPAADILQTEGARVLAEVPEGVCPLRILLLNLMPQKAVTELDIARMMAAAGYPVQLVPVKIAGQQYKTTPQEHMDAFYIDFEEAARRPFHGIIVTGAPVEHLPFEEVRYWPQLCDIMDSVRQAEVPALYICWGAQAALYHRYGVQKYMLPHKMFGIFSQRVVGDSPLVSGLAPHFFMPNSRHTEVRKEDFPADAVRVLAESEESGPGVMVSSDGLDVYIVGHLEYAADTLLREYRRDLAKGLPIMPPLHYFEHDCPDSPVRFSWHEAALRFYRNWLAAVAGRLR